MSVSLVDKTGPTDRAYYDLLKDLYTVAGLVDDSGEVVEAYGYDAYGQVRMFRIEGQVADADRDGDVDMSDFECLQRCFSGDGNAIPAGCSADEISQLDIDGDGDIDQSDMQVFLFCWHGPDWAIRATGDYDEDGWITAGVLPGGGVSDEENFILCTQKSLPQDPQCEVFDFDANGNIDLYDYGTFAGLVGQPAGTPWSGCVVAQAASEIGNPYYFTGQRLDAVPLAGETYPAQLYHYRARWYDPVHGRFGQRDPAVRGLDWSKSNLYQYVSSAPNEWTDPLGLKDYKIGTGPRPEIAWDKGFQYDSNAAPTWQDHANWEKFRVLNMGAKALDQLPNGTRAYSRYRDASGKDLEVDYNKAIREDRAITRGLDEELRGAQEDIERLHDGVITQFTVYSADSRLVLSATEDWQKALGGHRIWGTGDVTYNPTTCMYTLVIVVEMEDFYNFNKGQVDIATGLPDDQNGRFEVFGWAKSFYSRGKVSRTIQWKRHNTMEGTKADGSKDTRSRR